MKADNYDILKLNLEEGLLTITINRETKMNALNKATLEEIKDAMEYVYDEESVRGAIITGAGEKAFVAGADIEEIGSLTDVNSRKFSEFGHEVFGLIDNCHKPILAAINGFALGGGLELALACHMRVATVSSKFGLPEVNLGIIPGFGGTQRLAQIVGKGKAIEMMMTGEMISGQEALRVGLINHMVEGKENLLPKCREIMKKIFEKAPLAVGMIVNCVNAFYTGTENGYQTEANSFSNLVKTEDFQEGINSFLDKRKPSFEGQ